MLSRAGEKADRNRTVLSQFLIYVPPAGPRRRFSPMGNVA
jgi:hypothetical protein